MKSQILFGRESKKSASKKYILTLIHGEGAISQTRIVEQTRIRPGTAQALIEELMQEGLIQMSGEGKSKGGRKPTLLEINPDAYWTIGMDVDEERISAGIVDLKGRIVKSVGRTKCRFRNQEDFIDAVKQVIHELISAIPSTTPLLGAGIGLPGFVDRERGIARHCSYYDWMRDVPVKALLEEDFGFPFAIDNDTVVATLGEKWFGAGKGIDDFLYVDLGETVGMGTVIEGRLYTGFSGNAGELGHTVIQSNGPLCICGNEGCVEALASGMALRREAEELVRKGVISLISDSVQDPGEISIETIIRAAERGDKVAYKLVTEMATYLGLAISNVVNVLNPQKVILGGSLMGAKEIVSEAITKAIKSHCLFPIAAAVSVDVSQLVEKSGILGASTLVSQRFFDFS
jgi:N-acetylglucosamine repressor